MIAAAVYHDAIYDARAVDNEASSVAILAAAIEATEGPDGFHGEMVAAAPRLTHGVEVLVREHAKLSGLAAQIAALAGRAQLPVDADAIRETGMRLIGLLIRHRQRGADLIYEAYQSDLGGEN